MEKKGSETWRIAQRAAPTQVRGRIQAEPTEKEFAAVTRDRRCEDEKTDAPQNLVRWLK